MSDHTEPYTLEVSSGDERTPVFYTLLPMLVRSRLRRLLSSRRPRDQYNRQYNASPSGRRRSSTGWSGLSTPPPEYTSRTSLSEQVSDSEYIGDELSEGSPSSSSSRTAKKSNNGIKWEFSKQGLSLISLAAQEDTSQPNGQKSSIPFLTRQLYVHGLTYLLRGLPPNLSPEEKLSIWSSVPPEVFQDSAANALSRDAIVFGNAQLPRRDCEEPSLLHRALAASVVRLFIIFQFLLPYIKVFIGAAYRYERQHHVSERVFSSGIGTMGGMMKSSVQLGNTVCRMNNGKVGQSINEFTVWWVKGVTGGIHQGVGEGLVILGVDKQQPVRWN